MQYQGHLILNLMANSKKDMPIVHFTRHQPKQYCKHVPPLDRIGMYSFALNPFDFHS